MHYAISPASDPDHLFHVDAAGAVRVAGGLDREKTPAHTLFVWAVDDGVPPKTATATLTVSTHQPCSRAVVSSDVMAYISKDHYPRI